MAYVCLSCKTSTIHLVGLPPADKVQWPPWHVVAAPTRSYARMRRVLLWLPLAFLDGFRSMSVSLGVHIGQQNLHMAQLRSLWRRLDAARVDWISVWDHFYEAQSVYSAGTPVHVPNPMH